MTQQFLRTTSEHDWNDSPSLVADHHENHPEFEYASRGGRQWSPRSEYSTSLVPYRQPFVDHDHALLPQQVAQTNEDLPHAQARHDACPHNPCQINLCNDAAFDAYPSGGFNPNVALYDTPSNFSYDGTGVQFALPMAPMGPVWGFNNIQDFDQLGMSIPAGAQLSPAPYPAMVSAPPAPVPAPAPAPAPAAVNRLRCPHGCPATFSRGGEYRRHMMIHEPARYRCPMVDCPRTFSRADKLRDHAKRGHGGRNPLRL